MLEVSMPRAVVISPRVERFNDVLFICSAREKEHGLFESSHVTDVFENFESGHARYSPVEHKQVDGVSANGFDHVCAIVENAGAVACVFKNLANVLCEVRLVF
jgi:trehalose utilization protein